MRAMHINLISFSELIAQTVTGTFTANELVKDMKTDTDTDRNL